ncbi:MAG: TolC family protein [Acidobacteria bacterium]|nr:TolC family protein [Acidobacteriota bacterium]
MRFPVHRQIVISSLLLLGGLMGPAGAAGQTPADGPPDAGGEVSLAACLRIGLSQNPALAAAREGIRIAGEEAGMARAAYYPDVRLEGGYRRWQSHAFIPEIPVPGLPSTIGPIDDWSVRLRASYLLYDGGERAARYRGALAAAAAAGEDTRQLRQDLALAIHQAFYALTAADEARAAAQQQLARTRNNLRLTEVRLAAGAVSKADVLRARVEAADAELALVRVANLVEMRRADLNRTLGLPVETPLIIDPLVDDPAAPTKEEVSAAMDRAARQRPSILALRQRLEAGGQEVRAARSRYYPRFSLDGYAGWRDEEWAPEDADWSVGLSFSLPLFQGFSRRHELGRARAEQDRLAALLREARQQVRQDVWDAHLRIGEAREAVTAAAVLVADAAESLRLVQARYEAGAGTVNDLLDVQAALARAEAIQVEARMNLRQAQATFRWSTTDLLPEELDH